MEEGEEDGVVKLKDYIGVYPLAHPLEEGGQIGKGLMLKDIEVMFLHLEEILEPYRKTDRGVSSLGQKPQGKRAHLQYPEPALPEKGADLDLNSRFAQIGDVLIDPVSAAWADKRGFGKVKEF